MHNNIVMPTVGLADRAGVHALVRAGHERNFESLSFHEVPEAGRAEGSDGFDHFRGQLHFLVDLLLPHGRIQFIHRDVLLCRVVVLRIDMDK